MQNPGREWLTTPPSASYVRNTLYNTDLQSKIKLLIDTQIYTKNFQLANIFDLYPNLSRTKKYHIYHGKRQKGEIVLMKYIHLAISPTLFTC